MKKQLALILVLVLIAGLFSACAGQSASSEPAAQPSESAQTVQTTQTPAQSAPEAEATEPETEATEPETEATEPEAEATEPEAEAAPASEQEPEPEPEQAEEAAPQDMPEALAEPESETEPEPEEAPVPDGPAFQITYPLNAPGETITLWNTAPGVTRFYNSFNEMPVLQDVNAATGVEFYISEVSSASASEQFNLMIAAGGLCDLLPVANYYSGGLSQAYADEVIIDLEPYVADNMPDYAYRISQLDRASLETMYTDGMLLQFYTIADGPGFVSNLGSLTTRGDWLEALDYDYGDVFTFQEYDDLLHQIHSVYGCEYTIVASTNGGLSNVTWAFDIQPASMAADGSSIGEYVDAGQVKSPFTQDNYRNYLEWFIGLYNEGIINRDFYISELDRGLQFSYIGNGNIGFWNSSVDKYDEIYRYTEDPNLTLRALPEPRPSEDAEYDPWFQETSLASGTYAATQDCEHVELLCQWQNYFFTEPGWVFCNYGQEGDLYERDQDGNIQWTEAILHPTEFPNAEVGIRTFAFNGLCAFYDIADKLVPTFSDSAREAMEIWALEGGADHAYPAGAALTVDEQDSVTNQIIDICAAASEQLLRFVTGSVELNDETWDEYVDRLESLGLNEVLAVYQNAYDQYLAGER